ncbi:hypothetical protein KC342_g3003 [Hortaea werneckii]|nr:hypothetical protein KC342_g3003 [Hortaea werneckii]
MSQTIPDTHEIWRAVREDNLDYIKSQLSLQTASPNIVDKHGLTMAHYAVIYKRPRVFRFLIAVGTSTSSEDSSGLTPEAKVAQYCAWDLNLMAKYAVDLERTSEAFGFTELHASVIGLSPLPVLSTVKENRGLINKRDRAGMTPLHWAALRSDFEAQSILIAFGANSEAQDFAHKTPLHLACQNGASVQCLQGLLSAGANVNSRDYYDNVPAPWSRQLSRIDALTLSGVDVNAARKDETVAVQLAVARRSTKALQLLIDHGARVDVTLRDSGYGILHLAGLQYLTEESLVQQDRNSLSRLLTLANPSEALFRLSSRKLVRWRIGISAVRFRSSSPYADMTLPTPYRNIVDGLSKSKEEKWGFVIYRCTYKDDRDWERFKATVHRRTQEDMADSDVPEVANFLEWTFVDDRESLEGASKDYLRARHKAWAAKAFRAENPRALYDTSDGPRYRYFIQVDEEALQSVLSAPECDMLGEGYVYFVDSQREPMGEGEDEDEDEDECEEDRETFDPIEGCAEENVGWMKLAAVMIDATWYDTSSGFAYGGWYAFYKRPPETVLY